MNEIRFIGKRVGESLYIAKEKKLVDNIDNALTFGSEQLCKFLIESFIEHTIYEVKDFEIIKIRKESE